MNDTTADLPALPPPLASEDLRRALADVDARLSALAAAVAGTKPEEPKRAAVKPEAPPSPQPVETAVAQTPTVVVEPVKKVAEVPAKVTAPPAKVAEAAAKTAAPPAKVAAAPAKPVAAPAQAAPPPTAAAPAAEAEPAASQAAQRSAREEDEALLASLDPETAQAIKVMRRLSFENKSVRQLLEEYEQTRQTQGASDSRKKSWWSRG